MTDRERRVLALAGASTLVIVICLFADRPRSCRRAGFGFGEEASAVATGAVEEEGDQASVLQDWRSNDAVAHMSR